MPRPIILSVEGEIGAGKSTYIEILKNELISIGFKAVTVEEPVDEWVQSGTLSKFYSNPKLYAFQMQIKALTTRIDKINSAIEKNKDVDIYIMERSIYTDYHVFAKTLFLSGDMEEDQYRIYEDLWRVFTTSCKVLPTHFLYINTSIDKSIDRIHSRARECEDKISEIYQRNLKAANLKMMEKMVNKFTMDHGDENFRDISKKSLCISPVIDWILSIFKD